MYVQKRAASADAASADAASADAAGSDAASALSASGFAPAAHAPQHRPWPACLRGRCCGLGTASQGGKDVVGGGCDGPDWSWVP